MSDIDRQKDKKAGTISELRIIELLEKIEENTRVV